MTMCRELECARAFWNAQSSDLRGDRASKADLPSCKTLKFTFSAVLTQIGECIHSITDVFVRSHEFHGSYSTESVGQDIPGPSRIRYLPLKVSR